MNRNGYTLCVICETVGSFSSIAQVAADGVRIALRAGYRVTVVARLIDDALRGDVEWVELYVPPRVFVVQWLTGRHWVKRAMAGRQFDIVHAHQPQVADLADVYQCHFLTRSAYERNCLFDRSGTRALVDRAQKEIVLRAEDHFYRRWNGNTQMLFDSELTRQEFIRLYGKPLLEQVLPYAFPNPAFVSDVDRDQAKLKWLGRVPTVPVLGYLGGVQERKGYRRLMASIRQEPGLCLLMGGEFTGEADLTGLDGRVRTVGKVSDTASFYAACDVFIVPSLFEPLGLVAFEAAARGVPVIATPEVGALPHLLEFGAGVRWDPPAPLLPIVEEAIRNREAFGAGALAMANALGRKAYARSLMQTYAAVLSRKSKAEVPL